jgi:hypothetical protein
MESEYIPTFLQMYFSFVPPPPHLLLLLPPSPLQDIRPQGLLPLVKFGLCLGHPWLLILDDDSASFVWEFCFQSYVVCVFSYSFCIY